MFKTVEEGIGAYKKALRAYLEHCEEIDSRERKNRPESHYSTGVDWPLESRIWQDAARNRLDGMTAALGLSADERAVINQAVAVNL